jgi:hypothetical protein
MVADARLLFVVVGCCDGSLGLARDRLMAADEASD